MICIENKQSDPYFNQALEEVLFARFNGEEDLLLLWINRPCLVCGRYQNVFQEVDLFEADRREIPVIRRNTGGGTVYHDPGNLNYTIIRRRTADTPQDYDSFLSPVIAALQTLGVPAQKKNTCDIVIEGRKISGSAQAVKSDRILHHGTLLFDADLSSLHELLRPLPGTMCSKAVRSVPSPVTNIKPYLSGADEMNTEEFKEAFKKAVMGQNGCVTEADPETAEQALLLSREKYRTWAWNIGNSPKFTFTLGRDGLTLCVEKGIVVQCNRKELEGLPADTVWKEISRQ